MHLANVIYFSVSRLGRTKWQRTSSDSYLRKGVSLDKVTAAMDVYSARQNRAIFCQQERDVFVGGTWVIVQSPGLQLGHSLTGNESHSGQQYPAERERERLKGCCR